MNLFRSGENRICFVGGGGKVTLPISESILVQKNMGKGMFLAFSYLHILA